MNKFLFLPLFAALMVTGCNSPNAENGNSSSGSIKYATVEAYPHLNFDQPLFFTAADSFSNQVYVVERSGKIKFFNNNSATDSAQVFLDLSSQIDSSSQEKGLLGLAFHPDFKENGYFYVNYTNSNSTVIARFALDPKNPKAGDISSQKVLLSFSQPYANHNGGQLAFGPDGYLYIAAGDGGSAGDPNNNAQNLKTYLGKILRIDVDKTSPNKEYGIPSDNPFVGNTEGYFEEIYAYGLRNPWRFSFDHERNLLWAADVGQNRREEIDIIEKGKNYGWRIMEGTLEYSSSPGVKIEDLQPPLWEYGRSLGGCVIGGYVYYGKNTPSLQGAYIFGDYISGKIWALWLDDKRNPRNQELLDTDFQISSFGLDNNQELYIVDLRGKIYRLIER
ncbi:MAG TPA: PQQ-dependent sugar dehydrogenase [Desulfitobacteriaceae bacterium]|nr:PQQ-dependent sugar dehydrogenase [Desulfitobacteriaceae bacterium]